MSIPAGVPGGDQPTDEAVEAAAIALYEHSRDQNFSGEEWDWLNVGWCRDDYRADARVALVAAAAERLATVRGQRAVRDPRRCCCTNPTSPER